MRRNSLSLVTSNFHFLIKLYSRMLVLGGKKRKNANQTKNPPLPKKLPKKPQPTPTMPEVIFTLKTELHF